MSGITLPAEMDLRSVQDEPVSGRHHPAGPHQPGAVQVTEALREEPEREIEMSSSCPRCPRHPPGSLAGSGPEGRTGPDRLPLLAEI